MLGREDTGSYHMIRLTCREEAHICIIVHRRARLILHIHELGSDYSLRKDQ